MPSVSCCSRRLACSERVSWSSKQVLPLREGELIVLDQDGSNFVSGGLSWLDKLLVDSDFCKCMTVIKYSQFYDLLDDYNGSS